MQSALHATGTTVLHIKPHFLTTSEPVFAYNPRHMIYVEHETEYVERLDAWCLSEKKERFIWFLKDGRQEISFYLDITKPILKTNIWASPANGHVVGCLFRRYQTSYKLSKTYHNATKTRNCVNNISLFKALDFWFVYSSVLWKNIIRLLDRVNKNYNI
jgi:hypothetical protein